MSNYEQDFDDVEEGVDDLSLEAQEPIHQKMSQEQIESLSAYKDALTDKANTISATFHHHFKFDHANDAEPVTFNADVIKKALRENESVLVGINVMPIWWAKFSIPIGFWALSLQCLMDLIRRIQSIKKSDNSQARLGKGEILKQV